MAFSCVGPNASKAAGFLVRTFAVFPAFPWELEAVMPIKPATAKITDFETCFDVAPIASAEGPVIWAEVRIDYVLAGLKPSVTIRVPVPWTENETGEARKGRALRCARQLIDHACRAAGVSTTESDDSSVEEALASVTPSGMEGLAQELGLAHPTREPRRMRGHKADV
jgi:hypothetical protein